MVVAVDTMKCVAVCFLVVVVARAAETSKVGLNQLFQVTTLAANVSC